jgi:hypothetical protein
MAASDRPTRPSSRLGDRLTANRRRRFVGRGTEIDLFRQAFLADDLPFVVLHVYGPGGIGKTSLLREYARIASESDVLVVYLDGRDLDPTPSGFLGAVSRAAGAEPDVSIAEVLAGHVRVVLLIDTFEVLAPLDTWLREAFLPDLPGQTIVVIAGRQLPAAAWRTDVAWRDLTRIVALRNLSPAQSREFLTMSGVPHEQQSAVLDFTHGHPLALALIADVLAHEGTRSPFSPEKTPDVMRILLERFIRQVPTPTHRHALETCAHVRFTTEALLRNVLDGDGLENDDVHEVFTWLRDLSFVESSPSGVFPHDLARAILDADHRWRDSDGYADLHRRARRYYQRRLQEVRGHEQQRVILDLTYLHRNSLLKPYFDWTQYGELLVERASSADYPAIFEMLRHHEGPESARIAEYWTRRQPDAFTVLRQANGEVQAFITHLTVSDPTLADLSADPALRAAWNYVRRHAPLRSNEQVSYCRFGVDRDSYQDVSIAVNMMMALTMLRWLTEPMLAWSIMAEPNPEFWHAFYEFIDFHPAAEASFSSDGHRFAVYAHDWRVVALGQWLDLIGERELATDLASIDPATPTAAPIVVLSEPDFQSAAKQALRDLHRPAGLRANPLLRSRLLVESSGGDPAAEDLRDLILEAIRSLASNPRDEKLYRALKATYLESAVSQERAAERLDVPFGTYRHHLAAGAERVADWLWQRELRGLESPARHAQPTIVPIPLSDRQKLIGNWTEHDLVVGQSGD